MKASIIKALEGERYSPVRTRASIDKKVAAELANRKLPMIDKRKLFLVSIQISFLESKQITKVLQTKMTDFPTLLYTSASKTPTSSYT